MALRGATKKLPARMTRIARIPSGPNPRRSLATRSPEGGAARSPRGSSTTCSGDLASSFFIVLNSKEIVAEARKQTGPLFRVRGTSRRQLRRPWWLDTAESNVSQIVKDRIVKLRLSCWIIRIARWNDDYHTLPGTG